MNLMKFPKEWLKYIITAEIVLRRDISNVLTLVDRIYFYKILLRLETRRPLQSGTTDKQYFYRKILVLRSVY